MHRELWSSWFVLHVAAVFLRGGDRDRDRGGCRCRRGSLNRRIFRRAVEPRDRRTRKGRDGQIIGNSDGTRGRQRRRREIFRKPRGGRSRRSRRGRPLRRHGRRSCPHFHNRQWASRQNRNNLKSHDRSVARCHRRSNSRRGAARRNEPHRFGHGARARHRSRHTAARHRSFCRKCRRAAVILGVHLTFRAPFSR
jgi:hypothetical protein